MRHESIPPRVCASYDRQRPVVWAALLLCAAVLGPAAVLAAPWAPEEYNPKPLADDVLLPMPCGGAMAFRKVAVPASGPLSDRLIRLGSTDDERGYLEGPRPAYIAGAFSDGADARYFLIGKYEVTQLQYGALADKCPVPTPEGRLPQTGVSWIEAVDFANRYTLWILRNAAGKLPAEEHEPGFVRLPTEEEWEFAARGGVAVSDSDFQDATFPTPDGLEGYVWFAGPQSANGKVQRIGLLKPNPLGIHDILGNADEIVLDPFRLNKIDRLHGQAGGFIVRGGNFATAQDDVRTANRQEVPYYQGQDLRRSPTTGFRLAVSTRVVASRARLQEIETAWAALGTGKAAASAPAASGAVAPSRGDPVEELGAIAAAAADEALRQRLKNLQVAFRATFQARDEQRDRAAKARLRLGTFLCQKLKDDGVPIDRMHKVYDACVAARGAEDERCKSQRAALDADEATQWNNLRYYADTIVTLVDDYDDTVVSRQLAVLQSELGARDDLKPLIPVSGQYARHVAQFRKERTIPRATWLSECKSL